MQNQVLDDARPNWHLLPWLLHSMANCFDFPRNSPTSRSRSIFAFLGIGRTRSDFFLEQICFLSASSGRPKLLRHVRAKLEERFVSYQVWRLGRKKVATAIGSFFLSLSLVSEVPPAGIGCSRPTKRRRTWLIWREIPHAESTAVSKLLA